MKKDSIQQAQPKQKQPIEFKYIAETSKSNIKFLQLKNAPQWHTFKKYRYLGE
jgi:hypothetical protein